MSEGALKDQAPSSLREELQRLEQRHDEARIAFLGRAACVAGTYPEETLG